MKVRCRAASGADLPDEYLDPRVNLDRGARFPLVVDRTYVVYAVAFRGEQVWLYIEDEDALYYPRSYPAPLFDVVDGRVSRYWHFRQTPANRDHHAILAIEAWSGDDFFYDRLTDREEGACEIFQQAKRMMDLEDSRGAGPV